MTLRAFIRLFALIAVAGLLGACTSYRYVPPASDAGRQCVATCDTNRQICVMGKQQQASSEAQACEYRRSHQIRSCLATAFTPQLRAQCEKKAPSCSNFASTHVCDEGYRACFVQCGGRVFEE